MGTAIFHKRDFVVIAYWNNNLFSRWFLYSYDNFGFCYKTKVETDFRVRVRTEIRYSNIIIISL